MMRIPIISRIALRLPAFVLLCLSLACSPAGGQATGNQAPEPIVFERQTDFGPGDFVLTDPLSGLSALTSYKAVISITFDGTRDGSALSWKKAYSMLAANDSGARQWTIERSGSAIPPVSEFKAEMGGLVYESSAQGACTANLANADHPLAKQLELASFLPAVIGADEAGTESVNGIAATRYTFDETALIEAGWTDTNGEVWVAEDGGYIVRYTLTGKGDEHVFGEGIQGKQTVDYELTDPNAAGAIQLPEDCPPGMVDAPLLADAANVKRYPGSLTYTSATSIKDGAAFYEGQLAQAGWEPAGDAAIAEQAGFARFQKGDETLTLILTVKDANTVVSVLLERQQPAP